MRLKSLAILLVSVSFFVTMSIIAYAHGNDQHDSSSVGEINDPTWKLNEKIPWANSELIIEEKDYLTGESIVFRITIAENGAWRKETLKHPDEFGEGMIQIWDTEKFYTYYPLVDEFSIREEYSKNAKVIAHPLISTTFLENAVHQSKSHETNNTERIYKEVNGKDQTLYFMEKNQDILSKVQMITDGTVVKEVKLNDVKEDIDIDPQLFSIDKTKGTEW